MSINICLSFYLFTVTFLSHFLDQNIYDISGWLELNIIRDKLDLQWLLDFFSIFFKQVRLPFPLYYRILLVGTIFTNVLRNSLNIDIVKIICWSRLVIHWNKTVFRVLYLARMLWSKMALNNQNNRTKNWYSYTQAFVILYTNISLISILLFLLWVIKSHSMKWCLYYWFTLGKPEYSSRAAPLCCTLREQQEGYNKRGRRHIPAGGRV